MYNKLIEEKMEFKNTHPKEEEGEKKTKQVQQRKSTEEDSRFKPKYPSNCIKCEQTKPFFRKTISDCT